MSAVTFGWRGRLGVPYQGSKNAIAGELIAALPSGKRFVDLFAGGCAMTHAAILSGKYSAFVANDKQGFGVRLFCDAITGKCDGRWRTWVSREDFARLKDSDPLVALCWSFSDNGRDYLYGAGVEKLKRNLFDGVVSQFGTYDAFRRATKLGRECELECIERVHSLERLKALRDLIAKRPLLASQDDYRDVKTCAGDVVYADPPYANTQRYNAGTFDSRAFWDWVRTRPFPVFVSEYAAPPDFAPVWSKQKMKLMSAKGASGKVSEFLFVHRRFLSDWKRLNARRKVK